MALSVSAFPEHIQSRHTNELLAAGDDGNNRNVAATPRILGFFGAANSPASSKKPESLPTRDDEPDGLNSPPLIASIPVVPNSPTFQLSPPQEYENPLELEEQAAQNAPRRRQPSPFVRRTTPSPIRPGASPVSNRLEIGAATRSLPYPTHVSSKSTPPLSHPAHQWSSGELSSSSAGHSGQPLASSRPLPIVPSPASESFKPGLASLSSSPGTLASLKPASSIIPPSRSASTIAGSPKHSNVLPIPPNHSCNITTVPPRQSGNPTRTASPPSTASPITPPSSKVLITPSQRGHKPNSPSVSMRYQPLFVDPQSPETSPPTSSSPKQTCDTSIIAPSAIRPLPRIPPSLSSLINFGFPSSGVVTNGPNPTSGVHASLKRPRTSPGSFSGFSGWSSSGSSSAIPGSWASKPSSSRPSSPPSTGGCLRPTTTVHPRRPPALKMPRARSWSRTRRERSLDSSTRYSSRTPPSSAGLTTSFTVGKYGLQGQTGGRPVTKRSNMTPTIMGRQPGRRDSLLARSPSWETTDTSTGPALGKKSSQHQTSLSTSSITRSPTLRHVRPQSPPSGPVIRTRSTRANSAATTGSLPDQLNTHSGLKSGSRSASIPDASPIPSSVQTPYSTRDVAKTSSMESLHKHPLAVSLNEELSCGVSTSTIDSPLEFFVDGPESDVASSNRSPSPIRYALPGNGDSSDWNSTDAETTDDDLGGVSSSTSNSRGWAAGRRRTQLRSYRMDYRPQTQYRPADLDRERSFKFGSPPSGVRDAVIQDLSKPSRALPIPPKPAAREKKKPKEEKKKEKWSFSDFTAMGSLSSPSAPGTRASSPERKGRSRQPRRLAEAVSLALGSGSRHVSVSHSSSGSVSGPPFQPGLSTSKSQTNGVRPGGDVPGEYEVLDIRMPSNEDKDERRSNESSLSAPLDFRIGGSSSTLEPISPQTPVFFRKGSVAEESSRGDFARESSSSDVLWVTKEGKQSGLRDATVVESRLVFRSPSADDIENEDMPFMWLSKDKPPEKPAPFIPLPPHQSPRLVDDTLHDQQSELMEGTDFTLSQSPSRERVPRIIPPIASVGFPPISASVIYSTKREGRTDEVGRKQRTTSGPSRFNLTERNISAMQTGARGVRPTADMQSVGIGRNEDDIYCDEEAEKNLRVDSEVVVLNSRRVVERGRLWENSEETQVVDVIPKLRSLKTTR